MASGNVEKGIIFLESSDITDTIGASGNVSRNISSYVTIPNGYTIGAVTPIITGAYITTDGVIKVIGNAGDNTDLIIAIRNIGANQVTWKSRVKVVCFKQ